MLHFPGRRWCSWGVQALPTLPRIQGSPLTSPRVPHYWAASQSWVGVYAQNTIKPLCLMDKIGIYYLAERKISVSFLWLNNESLYIRFIADSPSSPIITEKKMLVWHVMAWPLQVFIKGKIKPEAGDWFHYIQKCFWSNEKQYLFH